MKPAAQRKQEERQRRRESGYVLVQEWCHRDDVEKLKGLAAELRKQREASNA